MIWPFKKKQKEYVVHWTLDGSVWDPITKERIPRPPSKRVDRIVGWGNDRYDSVHPIVLLNYKPYLVTTEKKNIYFEVYEEPKSIRHWEY